MNRTKSSLLRLLAIAALWPALTLGQAEAPAGAPEAAPAAAAPSAAAAAVEYSKKGADTCLTCPVGVKLASWVFCFFDSRILKAANLDAIEQGRE